MNNININRRNKIIRRRRYASQMDTTGITREQCPERDIEIFFKQARDLGYHTVHGATDRVYLQANYTFKDPYLLIEISRSYDGYIYSFPNLEDGKHKELIKAMYGWIQTHRKKEREEHARFLQSKEENT